jgi:hypothetical protein
VVSLFAALGHVLKPKRLTEISSTWDVCIAVIIFLNRHYTFSPNLPGSKAMGLIRLSFRLRCFICVSLPQRDIWFTRAV